MFKIFYQSKMLIRCVNRRGYISRETECLSRVTCLSVRHASLGRAQRRFQLFIDRDRHLFKKKTYACIKKKTAFEVAKAFESVLQESQIPEKLQTDVGKEFFNKTFQTKKKRGIVHFATASDLKASVLERFNCTLKTRMWRYFTVRNTSRYLEVLPELIDSYNNSYHRSIKMSPMEVTSENTVQVFRNLYGAVPSRRKTLMKFKKRGIWSEYPS